MISTAMRFASAVSEASSAVEAAEIAARETLLHLGGVSCDVAFIFASPVYRAAWPAVLERVQEILHPRVIIGCSGSGVIGGNQELEWVPAVSLVAAHLPNVRLFPFHITPEELQVSSAGGFWIDKIGAIPDSKPYFLLFPDPFTIPVEKLLEELNDTYRTRPIIGGLASGGQNVGEHVLFYKNEIFREGAVGLALTGNISIQTMVSQGCRPIGRPLIITKAEDNIVWQLGGRQSLVALHDVLSELPNEDRELAQQGSIFAGLAINEMRQRFGSGDFVIRNIVGVDPDTGAIAVAEQVDVGQTLQFQLRDPQASRQELRRLLHQQSQTSPYIPPAGCFLFACTGRGKALYGSAHQDVRMIQAISGKIPIGGFFCNGEIGPVHGVNFLHSYTASVALFRPALAATATTAHASQAETAT